MSGSSAEVFRLSWRSPLVGCLALLVGWPLVFAWPHLGFMLALGVQIVVAVVIMLLVSVISVTPEGIVLYFVNRLQWSEVTGVRRVSFLGLPYLYIMRARGLNWWLPLYFTGPRSIEAALADKAPPGNPLRTHVAASNT